MLTRKTRTHQAGPPRRRPAPVTLAAAVLAVPALSGAALAGALLAAPAASAQTGPTPSCTDGTCTVTFTETGAPVTWDVPTGVSSAAVTLYGANGGSGQNGVVETGDGPADGGAGGTGAEVTGALALSGISSLTVNVGGAGGIGQNGVGGYGGGGTAGGDTETLYFGGGGGGATTVSDSAGTLLVAGGGGGGGQGATYYRAGETGGAGGGGGNADTAGTAGTAADGSKSDLGSGGEGGPGTQAVGGAGGTGGTGTAGSCPVTLGPAGFPGSAGQGGGGGLLQGGGGGGGYYGGGEGGAGANDGTCGVDTGANGGGGGGSSYTGGTGVSGANVNDSPSAPASLDGNGEAVLSYGDPVATGSPSYTATAGQTLDVPAASGLLSTAAGTIQESGLTVSASGATAQDGTITLDSNGDGGFTYIPATDFAGTDTFSYTVTDAAGDYATGTATIDVQVGTQSITFTSTPPSPAVVGATYTPTATGGGSGNPVTFSIDSASTTGACSISTSGVVSFTGPGTCIIDANQAAGNGYAAAGQAQQSITVDAPPAFTVDSPPATATAGQVYSYSFVASGTPAPTYALAPGAPSWLTIDTSTGEVSGTVPKGTRSFSYSVTATNTAGTATAGPFTVKVAKAPVKADLSAKLSCPASLKTGGTGTCTLTVTNHGPAAAQKVAAAIALPASLGETACSTGCTRHANVLTWTQSSLADGATVTYTITVKAAAAGKALILAAAASASPDPDPLNNITLTTITITR